MKGKLVEKIISFLEIPMAIFIVLADNVWKLIKKPPAVVYLSLAFLLVCGGIYALFSDRAVAETNLQAGTVLVKLEEDSPFDDLGSILEEGAETSEKTFRGVSVCTLDTYVRAKIIPVIEQYNEEEDCYVVIPIDINDVTLSVDALDWTYSDGYYYYNYILEPENSTSDVIVTVASIRRKQ